MITGGSGLIGGRIANYLLKQGHQIVIGSRNDIQTRVYLNMEAEIVQTNWNDKRELQKICSGVDVIIHTAGMNSQDCVIDPIGALKFNGLGTAKLLHAAIDQNVSKFLYFSTAHVYTKNLVGIINEATCPINLHPYATSHLAGENVVLAANESHLINGIVLRLSNGFGVPIHPMVNCWKLFVNNLCRQAVETKRLVIRASGLTMRNFIPLKEICHAVDFIIQSSTQQKSTQNNAIINLGSNKSVTLLEMAILVQSRCRLVLGFEPELIHGKQNFEKQTMELDYCIDKLRKMGFESSMEMNQEIDSLLIYCYTNFSKV